MLVVGWWLFLFKTNGPQDLCGFKRAAARLGRGDEGKGGEAQARVDAAPQGVPLHLDHHRYPESRLHNSGELHRCSLGGRSHS